MPTARPIISARVGVVEETVATDATTRIPANVMPTPRPAVSSGRPAASNETKVTASTTKTTATPISSVALIAVPVLVYMEPPRETVNLEPGGGAAAFSTSVTAAAGKSVSETSNWIWDSASPLSFEIVPTAPDANGSSTLVTCPTFSIALI